MGRQQTFFLPYFLGSTSSLHASARSVEKGSVSWSIFTWRHGAVRFSSSCQRAVCSWLAPWQCSA